MQLEFVTRLRRRLAPALAAIGLAAGAAQPAAAQEPQRGGEVVFSLGSDLGSLNPALSTNIPDVMIGCALYEGLVEVSSNFEIRPLLARAWTISPDGLTYSFELQKANWSDGKPFTSADVAYSLLEVNAKLSPLFRVAGSMIAGIDTPAPDKVTIRLKQPFGPFLISLACIQGSAIMPEHVFKGTDVRANPANSDAPVGTGPFKLVKWQRGSSIELVRNADYWKPGRPYLDRLVGRIIPQASSRLQALQAGEIDFIQGWTLAPSDQAAVRANPKLKLETSGYASGTVFVAFNNAKPPLAEPRVRRALAMATDRPYILKTAWFGDGVVSVGPFNASIGWARNSDIDFGKQYPVDVATANKLLDEAGFPRNAQGTRFKLRVIYPSDAPDRAQVALALKSMWSKVGVEVQPESPERAVYANQVYVVGDYDVALEFLNTFGDPAIGITRIYAGEAIGRPYGNAARYSNDTVNRLFKEAQDATGPEARGKLYRDAQAILAGELPVLPIREARMQDAATVRLHGLWDVLGPADWTNAWLSKK